MSTPRTVPGLLGDFRLLIILFVSLRMSLLIAYQPLLLDGIDRGITAGGDFYTYYSLVRLTDTVGMPFESWWTEYPPLWVLLSVGLYAMLGPSASYTGFAALLALVTMTADAGVLALVRSIGARLRGEASGMAIAWVYALVPAPLILVFWNFEALVALSLLLGVWWLLEEREARSAVATALGALIKFVPALILGALWRYRPWQRALRYTLAVLGIFVLVYLPLLVQNPAMTAPSLTAQFNKASYQTVWALIDGNYRTGNFGPIEDRTDPAKAGERQGNPPVFPGWLRLGAAAGVGLWVYLRTRRFDGIGLVAFVTLTMLIFYLQSQGWSPQWLCSIVPLLLLCFPTRSGVLLVLLLSMLAFAEYPFLFIRTGATGGVISGSLVLPYAALIILRTGLLTGACVGLYRILRQEHSA